MNVCHTMISQGLISNLNSAINDNDFEKLVTAIQNAKDADIRPPPPEIQTAHTRFLSLCPAHWNNYKIRVDKDNGDHAGRDAGSGARTDLHYYAYTSSPWLMLSHGLNTSQSAPGCRTVREESTWYKDGTWKAIVVKATGWETRWTDAGSGHSRDYAIFKPTYHDSDYRACGVFCSFGVSGGNGNGCAGHKARLPSNVALIHKDFVTSYSPSRIWTDAGTGANQDANVYYGDGYSSCNNSSTYCVSSSHKA